MKKVVVVFGVSAVLLLVLASAALAQTYGDGGMSASPTATASASPTATASALPTTGGPPLGGPVTLVATLTLIGSGVGALVLLRGGGAVS
jgi:hypothetical protein